MSDEGRERRRPQPDGPDTDRRTLEEKVAWARANGIHVMTPEESDAWAEELRLASERAREKRGGRELRPENVNQAKWSDPVGLRIVERQEATDADGPTQSNQHGDSEDEA